MATIVTRAGKGSPLTNTEVDANFTNLNNAKYEAGNNVSVGTLAASGAASFSAGSAGAPSITATGDLNTGMFFPAADTIAFAEGGVEAMRLDASGRVGIGFASPDVRLRVQDNNPTRGIVATINNSGSSGQTGSQVQISQAGIADWAIGQPAATSAIAFWSGRSPSGDGTERMRVDVNGNISVNTTASSLWGSNHRAIVIGGGTAGHLVAPVNTITIGTNYYNDNTNWIYVTTGQNATRFDATPSGIFRWFNAPSGTAGNTITFTQAMTLDASGNLGIGTASPARPLDVNGTMRLSNDSSLEWGGTTARVSGSSGTNTLFFVTNNTEAMRIASTGRVGIGITNPSNVLHVRGASSTSNPTALFDGGGTSAIGLGSDGSNFSWIQSFGTTPLHINQQGNNVCMVPGSGNVAIGTTSPSNSLSFGGNVARTIWMERHTTADTAGNGLTVQAGGATSGATNKAGGNLVLSGGTATGSGGSAIIFNTATAGGAGTTDRSPSEKMRLLESGFLGIGTATPGARLEVFQSATNYIRIGAASTSAAGIQLSGNGNDYATASVLIQQDASSLLSIANLANAGIRLQTNALTRMVVSAAGDVGINETAPDYKLDVNGTFGFTPGSSVTPVDNGDVVIEATNNTTLTFKLKGSDGTVRTGTITLS